MRRVLTLIAVMVLLIPAFWQVAHACGDKFLMVGRGARFQRAYASVYPGHVVVYARKSLGAKAVITDARLHKLLRQAGHTVSVIEDDSLLEQAVKSASTDVLLVDLTDAQRVDGLAAASVSHPKVLPVRPTGKSPELDRLQQQFASKLKETDNAIKWLDALEDLMKARIAARRASKS